MNDGPPDDWDQAFEPGPTPKYRPKQSKSKKIPPPSLTPEAAAVRALWVEAVRAHHLMRSGQPSRYNSSPCWDGGYDDRTLRTYHKAIWPDLVAKSQAAGYAPRELIESLFSGWTSDTAPTPYAILSETNVRRAAAQRILRRRRIADSLRTEETLFRADLWGVSQSVPDPREATRRVLNDQGRALSPLFRYSVALIRGLPDVADRWEKAAEVQFRNDSKSYLEFWSTVIPEKLKTAIAAA